MRKLDTLRTCIFLSLALSLAPACGGDGDGGTPDAPPADGGADASPSVDAAPPDAGGPLQVDRDVASTDLVLDLTAKTGTATVRFLEHAEPGASLDVSGLTVNGVTGAAGPLPFAVTAGRLDIGGLPTTGETEVVIDYTFVANENFDGYMESAGLTFLWPYFCGNLFPCDPNPRDGSSFTMAVNGAPAGQEVIFPASIPAEAPGYMPAIAIGAYTYQKIGTTAAGTEVGVYSLPGDNDAGANDLDKYVDFFETTYGAYLYGNKVASVSADWGAGAYGGMEHHPYWHVAREAMADPMIHAHEAAHGWFGNGIRIHCWEDFVLSEGTATYLAARAIGAAAGPAAEQALWDEYQVYLDGAVANGDTIAWPDGCNQIDILSHPLWSLIPYMKGAFFLRAVENQVGRAAMDDALKAFYAAYQGKSAGMQDLLDTIQAETGFDPSSLSQGWLKSMGTPRRVPVAVPAKAKAKRSGAAAGPRRSIAR